MTTLSIRIVNPELAALYVKAASAHNEMVANDPYPNSGFDLFMPATATEVSLDSLLVSQGIQASMTDDREKPTGYYLYPRSSISKTPLILANQVGIIDSGYRGEIKAALRSLDPQGFTVEPFTRLVQICAPNLQPFRVEIVGGLTETTRGEAGFGQGTHTGNQGYLRDSSRVKPP